MAKRWVVGGIWAILMSAGVLTCGWCAAAEHPPEIPNTVQNVTFLGAKHIKEKDLREATGVQKGMPLNPNLNRRGCQRIVDKYEEMGRPCTQCTLVKGGDVGDTEVVYQIKEIEYRINAICVRGNKRISSESILAHIPLVPGQVISYADLKRAERILAKLGLFVVDEATGVRPTITVVDVEGDSDQKDLLITVKEKAEAKSKSGKRP